ncbi:MAG: ATP-dependent DNA helicase [Eubacteriales bacterium]|nr:ATP-dependent DNA helicase [Eubacteriales bacterium]
MDGEKRNTKKEIRISVRTLVEFLLRSGDLKGRRSGWADRDAMLAGSRIHRKIQKHRGTEYRAEVSLAFQREYDSFSLLVEGRADGIYTRKGIPCIEEIKGSYSEIERMEEPVPVHLAQAKCYAWMYLKGKEESCEAESRIAVCMTYVHLETEMQKQFFCEYTSLELENWFEELVEEYRRWAEFEIRWKNERDASIVGCTFPFDYREGQKGMVVDIYRTILRKKQLFVQAPTGIGKTMSAIFPSIHALGTGNAEKLFYLTAKTITRTVAEEAFRTLTDRGLAMKALTITAKEKVCILDKPDCDPENCPRARGHFDRINDCLFEILTEQDDYSRERILAQAEKWQVCPYELELDIALFADAVICDYNYVFDPTARLKRFFGETAGKGDYVFLIDEAHNLVDRGREMFSAGLYRQDFLDAANALKNHRKQLPEEADRDLLFASEKTEKALKSCSKLLLEMKRECTDILQLQGCGDLPIRLLNLSGCMEDLFAYLPNGELRTAMLDFYYQVAGFCGIADMVDENYLIYSERTPEDDLYVKLLCVNPSQNLQNCLDKGRTAVFFSATLLPIRYYQQLLTSREDNYAVYIDSPFRKEQRFLAAAGDVSTIYRRRTHEEFVRIAAYIQAVIEQKAGNYLVFFPSYQMMQSVYEVYLDGFLPQNDNPFAEEEQTSVRCVIQTPQMTEKDREEFLDHFGERRNETLIGFCVMGGIFSEGIDLTGEKLIGAIVVGTGIPQISKERELLRQYYDSRGMNGFDYAYRYPGLNKVLQAAGRVIRTKDDRGVVLLLDDRLSSREYRDLYPREWADLKRINLSSVRINVAKFWESVI